MKLAIPSSGFHKYPLVKTGATSSVGQRSIFSRLDGPVEVIAFSDPHGAHQKVRHLLSLFDRSKIIFGGDIFHRGPEEKKLFKLISSLDPSEGKFFPVLGNHDAMMLGAGLGDILSILNVVRYYARYGQLNEFQRDYGIDIENLVARSPSLSLQKNHDIWNGFEGVLADLIIRIIYSRGHLGRLNRDGVLLADLLRGRSRARDPWVKRVFEEVRKELAEVDPQHVEILERIRGEARPLNIEEKKFIASLRMAFLKNNEMRDIATTLLANFDLYKLLNIAGKNILVVHGGIPIDSNGEFLESHGHKGAGLLKHLQTKIEEMRKKLLPHLGGEGFEEALSSLSFKPKDFFEFLAWDERSPLFMRHRKFPEARMLGEKLPYAKEEANHWYKINGGSNIVDGIAREFNADPRTFLIVSGHKKNPSGKIETSRLDPRILFIDGGMSPNYGDAGTVMLLTDKGTVFGVSLKDGELTKLEDGRMVRVI